MSSSDSILSANLPFELTNGNDGRGSKWFKSAALRKKFEQRLRELGQERRPFARPVCVHLTRVLGPGQRFWDADSVLRGNAKELIDALVAVGWFVDDGPKWIVTATGSQDATQRVNGPSVIVTVTRLDDGKR